MRRLWPPARTSSVASMEDLVSGTGYGFLHREHWPRASLLDHRDDQYFLPVRGSGAFTAVRRVRVTVAILGDHSDRGLRRLRDRAAGHAACNRIDVRRHRAPAGRPRGL